MIKMSKDLSLLTTIPEKTLTSLFEKIIYCINEAVEEALLKKESIIEIDLFDLGTLYIQYSDIDIKYKFIPSTKLNKSIKNTIVNKENMLENVIKESLIKRLENVYKDLF